MMNMKKNIILFAFLFVGVLTGYCQQSAYLFVYFTGNRMSEEAVRMAVSLDGYNYKALNGNQPVLDSRVISSTGGVRDPHILRCEDGKTFYMVVTDMVSGNGWSSNRAMILFKRPCTLDFQYREYPEKISQSGGSETCVGSTNYL